MTEQELTRTVGDIFMCLKNLIDSTSWKFDKFPSKDGKQQKTPNENEAVKKD